MIRDAVALEQSGIPTVTIVHDKFVGAAQAQARMLNMQALSIAPVPQPVPWEAAEDETKEAGNVVATLVAMLTQGSAQAAEG